MVSKKKALIKNHILILLAATIASCGATSGTDDKKVLIEKSNGYELETIVATAIAKVKNFEYLINTNGRIRSVHEQLVTAATGGRVIRCRVETGKTVVAGSVLVQFETTSAQLRLQRANLNLFNGNIEYKSRLLGYENLLKGKSKEEADAIRYKLKIGTGLADAEQDIKEARYEISKATIKAPFSGILSKVQVQKGDHPRVGEELFRIYDPTELYLKVTVLEGDIGLLKKGMTATLKPISSTEQTYKASVYEINPYVDENGMVLVKLKLMNNDSEPLYPGMNCTATIYIPLQKSLVIPKAAVVMRSGRPVVFTFENGKAKWHYVKVGRENGKDIQIKEGLEAGMKVIITNNLQLAHDTPVMEEPDSSRANNEESLFH